MRLVIITISLAAIASLVCSWEAEQMVEASARFSALGQTTSSSKHYKLAEVGLPGSISPDGRFVSHVDTVFGEDHVFVRDLESGENRRLTEGPGEAGWGVSSVLSPDGKQVAYDWALGDQGEWLELRLIGVDGSSPRVLYRNNDLLSASVEAWSPDGTHLLATFLRKDLAYQIALVSVSDGTVRVVKSQPLKTVNGRHWGQKVSFSPDGRYIAYEFPPNRDASRDIFLLPADGGREIPLVRDSANNRLLDWTPDGKRILFASDRTGTWEAWLMPVAEGKPHGSPELAHVDIARIRRGLGFTQDGSYCYAVSSWVNDVYLAILDPTTGKLRGPEKLVSHVGPDTSVEWSPDGQYLAYASGYGHEPDLFVLGLRSVETGQERLLRLNGMVRLGGHAFEPHWSPDGRSLLAYGRDNKFMGPGIGMDSQGLYRIDAQTGMVSPLVQARTICPPDCVKWSVWSPNGTVIFVRWIGGFRSIVARALEGGSEKELYRAGSSATVADLAISPDGQQLAFVLWDWERRKVALKVIPTTGSEPRELLAVRLPGGISHPAWMPDGRHIVFAKDRPGFIFKLVVIGLSALALFVLALALGIWTFRKPGRLWRRFLLSGLPLAGLLLLAVLGLAWFKMSGGVARLFEKQEFELWRIAADGGEPQKLGLATEGRELYGLSVHPDGRRIAFTAGMPARSEVWVRENFLPVLKTAN